MPATADTPQPAVPVELRRAAWIVAGQGLALTALSVWYAVRGLTGAAESVPGAEFAALLGVLVGLALLVLARGLAGRRSWARAPLLVLELLALPVGLSLVQSGEPWPAVLLLGSVAAIGVLLVSPAARTALRE